MEKNNINSAKTIKHLNKTESITNYLQAHPYQYLRQLNDNFTYCNNNNTKCFSKASKIKLPWKQFTIINIPKCFQETFTIENKQITSSQSIQENKHQSINKIWKQHQQIIKIYSNYKTKHSTNANSRKIDSSILNNLTIRDPRNLFLKKIIQKGANIQCTNLDVQQQTIQKLANLNNQIKSRPKSAFPLRINTKKLQNISSQTNKNKNIEQNLLQPNKQLSKHSNFKENAQNCGQITKKKILSDYRNIIKAIDCSISQETLTKSRNILQKMNQIINNDVYS